MSGTQGGVHQGRTGRAVAAWESMFRAHVSVMRWLEATGSFGTLTSREYDVLVQLAKAPAEGVRQWQLAEVVMLPQPSLSRMLDRLEKRGLVCRIHPDDAPRTLLFALTDDGRVAQRIAGRAHVRALREALSVFTDEELDQLTELARRLHH